MGFEMATGYENIVQIKVVGVGGGGGNAVNRMVKSDIPGVEFIAINTDLHILQASQATHKLQIGEKITSGKGAGGKPEMGQRSAEESKDKISDILKGTDMLFITAGMGGGTGTGAAPVIASIAKEMGILTIGIVTKPFSFEGDRRMQHAEEGIAELEKYVDSLIVIPNERLKEYSEEPITLLNAFDIVDDLLRQGVRSISSLITERGFVNLDFADIDAVMRDGGKAHMGVGRASGKDKAEKAALAAISSPLLETKISGCKGAIISIKSSPDITVDEAYVASDLVSAQAAEGANIIWGCIFDETLKDEMIITVIATGFDGKTPQAAEKVMTNAKLDAMEGSILSDFGNDQGSSEIDVPVGNTEKKETSKDDVSDSDYFDDLDNIFNNR
ncbi:MAG: cell division protein FtsZ [Clostridia bacterium]|nr:cell division protein FtsZ [Clostridia bacterium]